MAPLINQIPSEILALIPDYWDTYNRDQDVIALTHVCRAWREVFTSRASLRTDFDCVDADKTRTYLERSKSSPLHLSLIGDHNLSPSDPFFEIIPHAIGRLKSLSVEGTPRNVQDITAHLSRPAPLLEDLTICGGVGHTTDRNPVLTPALFNGDLSSLRELSLEHVRTELPWRNMANLTSFMLVRPSPSEVTVRHLLDFFESAPQLRVVDLYFATPTSGAQNGRLVSLPRLKGMEITGDELPSLLLDHLLIPVGAELRTEVASVGHLINTHLPRSLDNLRNFSNFTTIELYGDNSHLQIKFSGPNGQVTMVQHISLVNGTCSVLESLAHFDTSKTECLKINHGEPSSSDTPFRALLPMKGLRTLTLSRCKNPHILTYALHPSTSPSEVVVCPKLEELVIEGGETLDVKNIIEMAGARASRGAKLKSVRINGPYKFVRLDVLELKKHVSLVDCSPEADGTCDDSDDSDDSEEGD